MPLGNNSPAVRGFNTIVAVSWKAFIACMVGPGVLYLDIAAGANYFQKAFEPYVLGSFNFDIPLLGWHIGWSHAVMLGFLLSAITSGVQVVLWNFAKTGIKIRSMKPLHMIAIAAAVLIFILDVMSDMGGATMWVSNTTDGALWPTNANLFQAITIPVIVIAGVANEAILEYFFGIDKPLAGGKGLRLLRGGKSSKVDSESSVA